MSTVLAVIKTVEEQQNQYSKLWSSASIYQRVLSVYHVNMDPEASRNARETLELAFQMSNILETVMDRHTLSVLIALCEKGLNPESLAALVKELRREPQTNPTTTSAVPTFP